MTREKKLMADGISVVPENAFQSFVTIIRRHKTLGSGSRIVIPKQIVKHLLLDEDSLIEVAIRKIPLSYAYEHYKIDLIPHWVICPKCTQRGRFTRFGVQGRYAIRHYTGGKGKGYFCFPSNMEAKKLLDEFNLRIKNR